MLLILDTVFCVVDVETCGGSMMVETGVVHHAMHTPSGMEKAAALYSISLLHVYDRIFYQSAWGELLYTFVGTTNTHTHRY